MTILPAALRCCWPTANPLLIEYHDREWGVPSHDDRDLFEMLVLQTMQAGLSWALVLAKRRTLREAFANFEPTDVARFGPRQVTTLLADPGVIRNRRKIEATIDNARRCLQVQREIGPLHAYLWRFVGGQPRCHGYRRLAEIPAQTRESDAMSRELRRRNFRLVGPVICYAFMQATGMVNDHLVNCFRYAELAAETQTGR